MKIHNPEPLNLVRLSIIRQGEKSKYINFVGVSQEDCIKEIKALVNSLNLSIFQEGNAVRIDFRACVGGKNGKSKSISFKGMTVDEVYKLIIEKYL